MSFSNVTWRTINDYPNYEVNNAGEVRNVKTNKVLKPRPSTKGYDRVSLYNKDGQRDAYIHRLVAQYFCDGYSNDLDVNHKNGHKTTNRSDNLEWCTRSENIRHAYETHLREPSGPHPIRKVKVVETGEIYNSARECARAIGGSQAHVSRCLNGEYSQHKGYHFIYADSCEEGGS